MREVGKYYPCKVCEKMFLLVHHLSLCCGSICSRENLRKLQNKAVKKYYQANRERIIKSQKEGYKKYYQEHKMERKEYNKKYFQEHKEQLIQAAKERRKRLKEEVTT